MANKLPSGYTELEYIQGTGTQYIDLSFNLNNQMKFVCDIEFTSFYGDDYDWFIGNRQATTNWLMGYYSGKACYWAGGYIYAGNLSTGQRITLTADFKNQKFLNSAGTTQSISTTGPSTYPPRLFIGNSASFTKGTKCKCYSVETYDGNGILISCCIPARRNSDSSVGLYDIIKNVFLANKGSGTFLAGPDIYYPNCWVNIDGVWKSVDGLTININ